MDGSKTARFEMSETLKALLKILLLLASAGIPYYFRFVLSMEVALADLLYALVILLVLWWPTGGTVAALSLSLLLIMSHVFTEPSTPLLHDLQRSLTLFAVALLTSALSRQAKGAEQEIRQRSQELSALNVIASTASQSLDLDEILKATLNKVLETIGVEAGGIYLLDQGDNKLVAKVYRGVSPEFVEETMRWDEGLARRGLRWGEPIVVEDISQEPGLTRMAARGEGLRSYVSVPLQSKDEVLGVMDVITRRPRRFAPRDVELLTSVGNQIGVAIENARLYEVAQREITERKRAEEELKELLKKIERAKQEWESTADSLPDLVCLVDDQGRIMRANRIVETWNLGRVVDVKGQGVHELLHPGCAGVLCYLNSFWERAWKEAIRGQPAQCEAYDEVLKRHVLVRVQPWKDWGKGTAFGSTVVVVRDITERKRAEEELKEYSERLEEMVEERTRELRDAQEQLIHKEKLAVLGELAGGVGHELRNPLGAIKTAAYFLNMVLGEPEPEVNETLEILQKEVATSERIISSLLDFARAKPPALRKVDVNDIVQEALSRVTVPENVEVVSQLDESLPAILADPDQLAQVFGNIILNAIQAMAEGGRLVIKTSASLRDARTRLSSLQAQAEGSVEPSEASSSEWVAISFADTGMGIAEENLDRLFEPLFTTKAKGIGLGLAVTKTLVEGHGGTVEVESEVGKGSTFTVRLPTDRGSAPSPSASP
jgi:PAS domain S-box-containing protein